jgi:hypothetical protein
MYIYLTYEKLKFSINDKIHFLITVWRIVIEFPLELVQFKAVTQHMQPHEGQLLRGPPNC